MRGFPNPFSTSCGQRPPYFAGRLEEKNRFRVSLVDAANKKPRNLAFVGDYGIGKTSLLFEFSKEAQLEKFTSIFMPCRRFSDEIGFYNFLLQSLGQAIQQSKWKLFLSHLKGVGFSVLGSGFSMQLKEAPADPIWGLVGVFEQAYKTIQQPLVILIDDFQDLVASAKDALQTLKQAFTVLVAQKEYPMMLIVASSIEAFKDLTEPYHPIARFFEPRRLSPLSYADINKATNVPLEKYGYKFDDDAVDAISRISEGRPYYIQLCAYYALEQAYAKTISKEEVEKGLDSAIRQLALEKYDMQLGNTSNSEKIVLKIVAENEPIPHNQIVQKSKKIGLKESTVKMAIKRLLENKRYIRKSNSEYLIYERMFREFLKTQNL